jgi:hypothetical protein
LREGVEFLAKQRAAETADGSGQRSAPVPRIERTLPQASRQQEIRRQREFAGAAGDKRGHGLIDSRTLRGIGGRARGGGW